MPEIVDLVHDTLRADMGLAEVKAWNKANGLLTLNSPGCSVGLEKEIYDEHNRDLDEVTANMSILLWIKNIDPSAGEAAVRALAHEARRALTENRTLGGAVANSYVHGIVYTTAAGDKNLILHLAEVDFRVKYYAPRRRPENPTPIEQVVTGAEREQ